MPHRAQGRYAFRALARDADILVPAANLNGGVPERYRCSRDSISLRLSEKCLQILLLRQRKSYSQRYPSIRLKSKRFSGGRNRCWKVEPRRRFSSLARPATVRLCSNTVPAKNRRCCYLQRNTPRKTIFGRPVREPTLVYSRWMRCRNWRVTGIRSAAIRLY
jgi:hypothetical protein